MPNVKIDREGCIGCGNCVAACPETFEMHTDGKARVKKQPKKITCEKEAERVCPVQVITVKD